MIKQGMRSRIKTLNRIILFTAILTTGLVIIASRLSPSAVTYAEVEISPIHSLLTTDIPESEQQSESEQSDLTITGQPETASLSVPILKSPSRDSAQDASKRIGILAGHWGYDSGAVCDDGLTEVEITKDISQRVVKILEAHGYQIDLLKEHHPDVPQEPLLGYTAAAFVSLHADSCLSGATGFKIARWQHSKIARTEDRLVRCLYKEYAAATNLPRHDYSITDDMRNYYAFREIGKPTSGAIVEMGFMTDDRHILVEQPERAAQGIAAGIRCFVEDTMENQ